MKLSSTYTTRLVLLAAISAAAWLGLSARAGEVTYGYDAAGRLRTVTQTNSDQRSYRLDAAGNRVNESVTVGGGFLQFSQASYSITENGGTLAIPVSRTGSTASAVSIPYSASGTATSGSDYSLSGTLSWTAGETASKNLTLTVTDDTGVEAAETLIVTLGTPTGGALAGSVKQTTVTIVDNDATFAINDVSIGEAGGNAVFTVTKTGNPGVAHQLQYTTANGTATAPADYTSRSGTLNFAVGVATQTISVPIISDTTFDSNATFTGPLNETFTVTLTAVTPGAQLTRATGTATIIEDDPMPPRGTVQFTTVGTTVSESVGSVTFQVSRTGGSFGPAAVTCVAITMPGNADSTDFDPTPRTMSWSNGDTANKPCTIPIINDLVVEDYCPDPPGDCPHFESFNVQLQNPTGASLGPVLNQSASIIINDDDVPAIPGAFRFAINQATVAEGSGTTSYVVNRVGASGPFGAASVVCGSSNGSATAGADFATVSQTLSWGAGDAADKSCNVSITQDSSFEGNETFSIALSSPTGGATISNPPSIQFTITDDDPAPPALPSTPLWTMPGCTPTAPCGSDTTSSFQVQIGLTWTPGAGGGAVQRYEVETLDPVLSSSWTNIYSGTGTSKTYTIQPDQGASFRVRACNVSGCSLWSPDYSFTVISP